MQRDINTSIQTPQQKIPRFPHEPQTICKDVPKVVGGGTKLPILRHFLYSSRRLVPHLQTRYVEPTNLLPNPALRQPIPSDLTHIILISPHTLPSISRSTQWLLPSNSSLELSTYPVKLRLAPYCIPTNIKFGRNLTG